jgi:glucokinase
VAVGPNPPRIYENVFKLFLKIYSAAIANFVAQHLTTGGMYLIGGLTKSILPRIVGSDLFEEYRERHFDVVKLVEGVPIVVCN